jgi:hypothetical protein
VGALWFYWSSHFKQELPLEPFIKNKIEVEQEAEPPLRTNKNLVLACMKLMDGFKTWTDEYSERYDKMKLDAETRQ